MQPTDPGDRSTQSYQFKTVKLVGSTKVMDDFGDRFASLWMALVVGNLKVLDDRAIFVGAFCCSQVHAYVNSMYRQLMQGNKYNSCAYIFQLTPDIWLDICC
jgi:hypothetical protein